MPPSSVLRAFRPASATCRIVAPAIRPLHQSTPVAAKVIKPDTSMDKNFDSITRNFARASPYGSLIPGQSASAVGDLHKGDWPEESNHHLHIYAHKHNTHITLTDPSRNPLVSVSCGNIGFRKAARGSYDAAYQLAAFVMLRIKDMGWLPRIQGVELVYRGFGQGREAVTKAILGSEGRDVRPLIKKLSDSTRLKFGGTRSKKPRRLG